MVYKSAGFDQRLIEIMKSTEFNKSYEIDRKTRAGIRAVPKQSTAELPQIMTADGVIYDPDQTYFFFDAQTAEVRQSLGLRRDGEHLCTFGLRVVQVSKLRSNRDDALADGQAFFSSEINRLHKQIQNFELEKSGKNRSLKTFLMQK